MSRKVKKSEQDFIERHNKKVEEKIKLISELEEVVKEKETKIKEIEKPEFDWRYKYEEAVEHFSKLDQRYFMPDKNADINCLNFCNMICSNSKRYTDQEKVIAQSIY